MTSPPGFDAYVVLKLAEDGVLGLGDRLSWSWWIPEFPIAGITLRQLLNHTAGTADFVDHGRFLAAQRPRGLAAAWTPRQLLRYVPEPLAKPGERWSYSNAKYVLLGLAVERMTHSTVGRELHGRLLPRAMFDRTLFQGEERLRGAVAVGYRQLNGDPELESTPTTRTCPARWKPPAPGPRVTCSRVPRTSHERATGSFAGSCSALDRGGR